MKGEFLGKEGTPAPKRGIRFFTKSQMASKGKKRFAFAGRTQGSFLGREGIHQI